MTAYNDDNRQVCFECNACSNTLETETDDFGLARNVLKNEGWITIKEGSTWLHVCCMTYGQYMREKETEEEAQRIKEEKEFNNLPSYLKDEIPF